MNPNNDWPITFIMQGYISPDFWTTDSATVAAKDIDPSDDDFSHRARNSQRHFSLSAFIACILLMLSGFTLATYKQQIATAVSQQTQQLATEFETPQR
jgi:hypothetical protein